MRVVLSFLILLPPTRSQVPCQLMSREYLVPPGDEAQASLPVLRLGLALPESWTGAPACCGDEGAGVLHVRVRAAPDREQPYSAHLDQTNRSISLIVKVYPEEGSPGVSGYLESVEVGSSIDVSEIRAWDYHHSSRRTAMVCFGVGITECLGISEVLLARGAEVRMVYASRDPAQVLLLAELRGVLNANPTRFRVRHCLSRRHPTLGLKLVQPALAPPGERVTHGRIDATVLREEFDGAWGDGAPVEHFLLVGSREMEMAALGMVFEAGLRDKSQVRGHPDFLLMKGPHGQNTNWLPLAPARTTLQSEL